LSSWLLAAAMEYLCLPGQLKALSGTEGLAEMSLLRLGLRGLLLFILMGIASYIVSLSHRDTEKKKALFIYGLQLAVNFFWSIIFFNLGRYLLAFIWLLLLLVLIIITTLDFKKFSKTAAYLMIPYILWVIFAGYLNFGVYILN